MGDQSKEEESLDPRVQGELETMNQCTDRINSLELEISEERLKFKNLLSYATQQISTLGKKYSRWIERARPYYEAAKQAKQAHSALLRAVHNFQKSNGIHRAAKETISLAEQRLQEFPGQEVDAAWQEMLNLQTERFMAAEADRTRSHRIHQQAARRYEYLDQKAQKIKSKHKRSTSRSRVYFETKEKLELSLQQQRQKVDELSRKIDDSKAKYREALERLGMISQEIHERRKIASEEILRESDEVDSASSYTELDLTGPKDYENIDDLEADLETFSFNDVDSDVSLSGSDEDWNESDTSASSGRTSSSTSPGIVRRHSSRHRVLRQVSSNSADDDTSYVTRRNRRKKLTPPKQNALLEETPVFTRPVPQKPVIPPKPAALRRPSAAKSTIMTYDTLHGVVANGNEDKSQDYDIFEDLC
ncbi:SH3 domain-binding protein 5-like [Ciona intestinalis]